MSNNVKLLKTLEVAFKTFEKAGRSRTFTSTARENLGDWFSARGIREKYGVNYYTFMSRFIDENSELNAVTQIGEEKLLDFLRKIDGMVRGDSELSQICQGIKSGNESYDINESASSEEENEELLVEVPNEPFEDEEQPVVAANNFETKTTTKGGQVHAGLTLNIDLEQILTKLAIDHMENPANGILKYAADRIKEEAQKLQPHKITINTGKPVILNGRMHKKFSEALELITIERQLFIQGPAGTGKTTLAEQISKALQLRFSHISCTAGMSEAHLLGRMIADGSYIKSDFVDCYENGGVFLFDEIDAADSNTLLIINSALANGYMSVPNRKDNPIAKRNPNFYAVCAANTWGHGSNEYAGRSILDAAFLDRFVGCKLEVDYDTELERELLGEHKDHAQALWKIRENVKKNRIRRVVSTRVFASAGRHLSAGRTFEKFLSVFFEGWSEQEMEKAIGMNNN